MFLVQNPEPSYIDRTKQHYAPTLKKKKIKYNNALVVVEMLSAALLIWETAT